MNNEQTLMAALAPKSDQLNADDLIVGNMVIQVEKVLVNLQSEAQKVVVHYVGDNGKPWKPSKSMGRVLAELLGGDFEKWKGERIELFRNKEISFGASKNCGGIQIAAMQSLKNPTTIMITTKRGVKSKITIQPMVTVTSQQKQQQQAPAAQQQQAPAAQAPKTITPQREWAVKLKAAVNYGSAAVDEIWQRVPTELQGDLQEFYDKQRAESVRFDAPPQAEEPPAYTEAPENVGQQEEPNIQDF